MLEKVEVGSSYSIADNIKLGTGIIYKGNKQLRRCKSQIIGVDLTAFAVRIPLFLVKHSQGKKVNETKYSEHQIVYCADCKFVWADYDDIEFMEGDKNEQ